VSRVALAGTDQSRGSALMLVIRFLNDGNVVYENGELCPLESQLQVVPAVRSREPLYRACAE
jgi:hypothetical protein